MALPRRRVLTFAALASVSVLGLTACSGTPASSGTGAASSPAANQGQAITLTVWADQTKIPAIQAVAPAFEKANNVKIQAVAKPGDQLTANVIQQAPTGKGPDIFQDATNSTGNYVDNGVLSPITIANTGDFNPVAITAITYQDKTWGMPLNTENVALYRNTDLVPDAPTSWEQLVSEGNKLKSSGKTKYNFFVQSGTAGAADPYHLWPLMTSFGINAYKLTDGTYDYSQLDLGGANGAKWANFLAAQGKSGVLNPNYTFDIGTAAFAGGQTPFFISGPWALASFKDKVKYSVDPIPGPGGGTAAPFVGGQAMFVNKFSKNQLLAQKFVADYLGQKDSQVTFYKTGLRPPANTAAFQEVSTDPDIAAFGKVGQSGVPFPNTTSFNALLAAVGATEGAIVSGKASNAASAWQSMVDKQQAAAK